MVSGAQAPTIARPGKLPRDDEHAGNEFAWLLEHRAQILASIAVAAIAVGAALGSGIYASGGSRSAQ